MSALIQQRSPCCTSDKLRRDCKRLEGLHEGGEGRRGNKKKGVRNRNIKRKKKRAKNLRNSKAAAELLIRTKSPWTYFPRKTRQRHPPGPE